MRRAARIEQFVEILSEWYDRQKRVLPWRDLPDRDPDHRAYKILVSEVMLQQTQVPRVIITYKQFLRTFPTVADLATAGNRDVILAWRGMGYNNRALRLRDTMRTVMEEHAGVFPRDMAALVALPGLGHYTAAAVRNFAFDLPTPCIDTNVRRVLHRTFYGPEQADGTWPVGDAVLLGMCDDTLQAWLAAGHSARDFFAALMDFGSLVQTKRHPRWDVCPLTAAHLMKATPRNTPTLSSRAAGSAEPGRIIAGRFIPNRIIRGKIVEELRDAPKGLTLQELGVRVCSDWMAEEQTPWLTDILQTLQKDALISQSGTRCTLRQ